MFLSSPAALVIAWGCAVPELSKVWVVFVPSLFILEMVVTTDPSAFFSVFRTSDVPSDFRMEMTVRPQVWDVLGGITALWNKFAGGICLADLFFGCGFLRGVGTSMGCVPWIKSKIFCSSDSLSLGFCCGSEGTKMSWIRGSGSSSMDLWSGDRRFNRASSWSA